jgi:hypothetical protein
MAHRGAGATGTSSKVEGGEGDRRAYSIKELLALLGQLDFEDDYEGMRVYEGYHIRPQIFKTKG